MFPDLRRDVVFPIAGSVILFTLVVASGLVYQSQFGGVGERLITMALIDAIIVLGMQVFIGNTGILSFGHIGFGAIAGYAFAVSAISPVEKMKRIPDAPFGLTDVNVDPLLAYPGTVQVPACLPALWDVSKGHRGHWSRQES